MALLNPVAVLLLTTAILVGCESLPQALPKALPEAGPKPMASDRIAWIERQFKTCSGTACPIPTRKTLAIVELPVATDEPAPAVSGVHQTPPPVASDSPVATAAEPATASIHFEYGQETPTADGQRELERLAAIAVKYQRIELVGRTDDIGGKAYNDRLARRRAESVRSWLLDRGVQAEILVRAEGLCCYLDPAPTEAARRSNRRVEVRLAGPRDGLSDNNRSNNRKGA
ncbi:MAG: Photosystem I P700 chlorophyll a apoprotein A2 [Candidatus Accumulibacter regalis]|uniref:Photosystem I P700 chlorophyll a apoprotein A2 n=2 Tax=Candidatus Accumulibacter TaxID=327159 RepID=A0A011P6C5_ACCRE|nr:MAG: Photosystem I P700 chlorophyll a apoprotein A2 [Candidatus Accumulibacter regalis]